MVLSWLYGLAGAVLSFFGVIVLIFGVIAYLAGGNGFTVYFPLGIIAVVGGSFLRYLSKQTVKTK